MSDVSGQHPPQPITLMPAAGIATSALVVGDPARAVAVAGRLAGARELGANREYRSFTGFWKGTEVVVLSHGVGAAGAFCAFEELLDAGVRTVVRLGTAGAMTSRLQTGDLVVAEAAVRDDGVTHQFLPETYPAYCTPEVVLALAGAAADAGRPVRRSVVWTRALFRPGHQPLPTEALRAAGVSALEMELSALLVLGVSRGVRVGGLLVVDGVSADDAPYDPHSSALREGVDAATVIALDALHALAQEHAP